MAVCIDLKAYPHKVTVIVAIYNSGNFLRQGLESLLGQTWQNIEVLMMDDGSTDDSAAICDEYAELDSRFIAVHKSNTGVCDSRNQALEKATGEYVCFMDGDDWLADDFVEYMMYLIEKTGAQMAMSDKLFTSQNQSQAHDDTVETWDFEKAITGIIYPYITLGPWNKIYSMKVIKERSIRFPSHWFGETLHFANTVAYYSGIVGVGHRKVYNYRTDNENSGTAQYNVNYRLLSLGNALNLRNSCFATTEKIKNAIEWHIYINYYSLLYHIFATNSVATYEKEYREAERYLKKNWFRIFVKSDIRPKQRCAVLLDAFCPVLMARYRMYVYNKKHFFGKVS